MRRSAWALLAAFVVLLAAGSRSLAQDQKAEPTATVGDLHRLGYSLRWATDLDVPQDQQIASVEVLDDVIATLETPSHMLTAVSANDGRLMWRHVVTTSAEELFAPFRTPSRKEIDENGHLIGLDKLVMVNSENEIYMFAISDGRAVSSRDLPVAVDNAPAITDNYAIFGSADGEAMAIDLVNGFKRWAYKMPAAAIVARPVIIKPSVFVADVSGIYAMIVAYPYSPEDVPGLLRWKGRTFDRVETPPAVNNDGIYLASQDQSLYSFNRVNGHDRWIYRAGEPLKLSPVALGNSLYLPLTSGSLLSIDPATGIKSWEFPHLAKPVLLQGRAAPAQRRQHPLDGGQPNRHRHAGG